MARLAYSPEAIADIEEITAFSVERFGLYVADAYLTGLEAACEQLRDFPEMGPIYPRVRPEIRCLIHQRRRIFYRFEEGIVLILRILHHARDVQPALDLIDRN